jgi:butyryl-CoA dehydrogenase
MTFDLTPEQAAFRASTEELAAAHVAPVAAAIDQTGEYPRTLIAALAKNGLLGVTIPREWGGAGRDYVSYALALETLARASAVVSVIASVNNSLVAEPLAAFGSDTQKEMWLRRIATGESIGAFALSERQAGSDAANQQTTARLDERGYVIDGHKVWVANGEVADLAIVFAATQPGSRGRGVGAFLVPLDTPGLTCVPTGESLGVRGLGCVDMELRDVRVDAGALLGGVHDGFQIAMWALDGGRVAIAAQALGVGQAALAEAIAHAKSHAAFGQPISNYEATELDAARMLMLKAADARTRNPRPTLEAAMAKLAASEAAHRAADRAMQILASHGYRRGSVVERLFRDVRATEIYQGTSEVQRMVISEFVI